MDVFVYGTLTEPEQVTEVLDSFVFVGSATLTGLRLVEGRYPTLAPGGETAGRLLRTEEIEALDEYERVDDGLYRRVSVPLDAPGEHPDEAAVYVGDPDRLDAAARWPPSFGAEMSSKRSESRTQSGSGTQSGPGSGTQSEPGTQSGSGSGSREGFGDRVSAYLERADVRVRLTP